MGAHQALGRRPAPSRHGRRAGLTFLELLVAVSLAILVAAVALAAWQAVAISVRRQAEWRDAVLPAEAALSAISRDLSGALVPFSAPSNALVLEVETAPGPVKGMVALSLITADPAGTGDVGSRAYSLARVRYGVAPSSRPAGGLALVSERQALFPAGEPERREWAHGVVTFEVLVQGDEGWTNAWAAGAPADLPRLAKIRLVIRQHGQDHALEAVAAMPAGLRLEPPSKAEGP